AGRVTVETDPLGRHSDTAYDVEGDLVSTITLAKDDRPGTTERAKRTIVDTYDIVGRRTQRNLGSTGPVYTWGYDAKDRTTFYGDPPGKREGAYDDEDQIKSGTRTDDTGLVETFGYGYDERGNATRRTYPDAAHSRVPSGRASRLPPVTGAGRGVGAVGSGSR